MTPSSSKVWSLHRTQGGSAIGGDVPANGSWAHYGTTRCTTASSRPLLKVTDPPDNGTLHAYVRDPSTGNRLGPIVSIHQTNTNFNQLGPLGSGQCFRLSARKDGFFGSGVVHWTGLLRY